MKDNIVGKATNIQKMPGNSLRSHSEVGIPNELLCLLNLDACIGFLCYTFVQSCGLVAH